jgi:beta-glucosidase
VSEPLSLEAKASLTSGAGWWHTQTIDAAGIPAIRMADGPHGLRKQLVAEDGPDAAVGTTVPATCFPPAVGLGSSWNPGLVRRVGAAIGREARAESIAVVLGPGVNIKRSPLCGRNFEYFAEDPFLAGAVGAAWVDGVQSQGIGASLKHFAANNQETDRFRVSAEVDERSLREIYLPAFERVVVEQQPFTVMCAYNKVNGMYASQDRWLLTEVLREEWGFTGLVVSDWGAVNDRVAAVAAGLDLAMPGGGSDAWVAKAVERGELSEGVLDQANERLFRLIDRTSAAIVAGGAVDHRAHHQLAHEVALECAVLLKNDDGILPLATNGARTIAVIGEFARTPRYQGAGSSQVVPTQVDDALTELRATLGDARVRFAPGFTIAPNGGAMEGAEARDRATTDARLLTEARELAATVDTVVCFLGLEAASESEGYDRAHIDLPARQLNLLADVAAVNPEVVVVLSNGGLVSVAEWEHHAKAVLEGWLLGQASGAALADLLVGVANPSGHLTETIPRRLADHPSFLHFPGSEQRVVYGETVFVGYRGFDTLGTAVAHPFGHGLSYTTFEYTDVSADDVGVRPGIAVRVSFTLTNTGPVAGAEVAQVYVRPPESTVDRPAHELAGFAKVFLPPGASEVVTVVLDERAFAYWSVQAGRWRVEPGRYVLEVGGSSRDIRLTAFFESAGDGIPLPLTEMSSVEEWLADPIGRRVLAEHLPAVAGPDGLATGPLSSRMRMLLGMPLLKVASMGLGGRRPVFRALEAVEAERAGAT